MKKVFETMAFICGFVGLGGLAGSCELGDARGMMIAILVCIISALLALVSIEMERRQQIEEENSRIIADVDGFIGRVELLCTRK